MLHPHHVAFFLCELVLCCLDVIWLYWSYPPFSEVLLFGVSISLLDLYVIVRCFFLLVLYIALYRSLYDTFHILKAFQVFIVGVFINWAIIVAFGGYFIDTLRENLVLASLLSSEWWMLSIYLSPSKILQKPEGKPPKIELLFYSLAITSTLGCWFGAFPIPLDWDRIWQTWPFTCVLGVFLGKIGGYVILFPLLCLQQWIRKEKYL